MRYLISIILLFTFTGVLAQQDMQTGFKFLENGQFGEAAVFFKNYLAKDPENRTALICYGRAIGLTGDITGARKIFSDLEKRFPGDFEVNLNIAEAFMWGKSYPEAKGLYRKLLEQHPESFPVNLGLGNAFSSLLQYDSALYFINRALTIQAGNANANISLKYTRLGLADLDVRTQQYKQAKEQLDSIFLIFPHDKEASFALGQLYVQEQKYKEARSTFNEMLQLKQDSLNVLLSLSYLSFLQKQKKQALEFANRAIGVSKDSTGYLKARLGRINALGWNEQYRLAFRELDTLEQLYPGNPDIIVRRAALLTWNKDFARSASLFKSALAKVPYSFDANLGTADALFAQEQDAASRNYVMSTLKYFPDQKDAKEFLDRIILRHAPSISTQDYRSNDKGGNVAYNYQLALGVDLATALRLNLEYRLRHAENKNGNVTADNENYVAGLRWRIMPVWLLTGNINISRLKGMNENTHLLADIGTEFKIAKWHTVELRYKSEVQNFTADLINSNIKLHNYILTYNLATPFRAGLYAQYFYTGFSDANKRSLLFASLYYNFKTDPVVKAGFNFNTMVFKNQEPLKYFSPSIFTSYELFATIENLQIPKKKLLYQVFLAGGYQQIEHAAYQAIYRITLSLGYRPVNNFEASAYYLHSNSASSTVAGYTYSEVGLRARWVIKQLYKNWFHAKNLER